MQDPKAKLTVLFSDNGSFTDASDSLDDYGRDSFPVELVAAEDKLYVGYEKPINAFYLELEVANTTTNIMSLKYFNGSAFTAVKDYKDDTKGMTRSGFVHWQRDQVDADGRLDEAKTTINGLEQYWYEVTVSADHSVGTELKGLNLVFADDEDLRGEVPEIADFRNASESSFILVHQAVKNELIQDLRNKGRLKQKDNTSAKLNQRYDLKNIVCWDLLDPFEVRVAAKFWALEKIFFNISDALDDKHYQRYQDFREKRNEAYQLFFMSLDIDDDGITDSNEQLDLKRTEITRV